LELKDRLPVPRPAVFRQGEPRPFVFKIRAFQIRGIKKKHPWTPPMRGWNNDSRKKRYTNSWKGGQWKRRSVSPDEKGTNWGKVRKTAGDQKGGGTGKGKPNVFFPGGGFRFCNGLRKGRKESYGGEYNVGGR